MDTRERDKFIEFAKNESPLFRSMIEVMFHSQKTEGQHYLCAFNNVIDYVLNKKTENESINYQIIHIPNCPDWARELLIRFTIHKMALCLNTTTIERLTKYITKNQVVNLKEGEGKKEYTKLLEKKKHFRKICQLFDGRDLPKNNRKSLIITKEQDLKSNKLDKNPWICDFFSDKLNDDSHNLILSTIMTAFDLEKMLKEGKQDTPNINNIFIFHSPNKSKTTNSYNKNQLDRLNKYGMNVKNCITFSFSDKPFRLYYTIDNIKYRLTSSLLNKAINKYDDFGGFITFTQEEMAFLFNYSINQKTFFIDCQERIFFTAEIDQFVEQLPHNLRYKNNLALSFTDDLQSKVIQHITEENCNFPIDSFSNLFNLHKQLWQDTIKDVIETFIGESSVVGFILPKDIANNTKLSLIGLFRKQNRIIKCFSLDELKNGVKAEKIINFQYRYTDKFYKSYPNSFDPLPLKETQSTLVVVNRLTHNNYYEWNIYWYDRDKNKLLFSDFRRDVLGWKKKSFQRPMHPDIRDYVEEAENDARSYQTERCKIFYHEGGRPKEYMACERVLYKENDAFHIAELKDLTDIENISIRMLDEIVEQVKNLISEKSEEDKTRTEAYLRKDPKYNLSENEVISSTELWKILLKRKITEIGERAVYDTMFSVIPENERISFNTFSQWSNPDNAMILPRSRKHQKVLLAYLGFELGSPYHRIIITKKIFNINNSRLLNSQIEILLRRTLINNIDEKSFCSLLESHSDIFTLLGIRNIEDLNALISLLDISLTLIKRIEYDQD